MGEILNVLFVVAMQISGLEAPERPIISIATERQINQLFCRKDVCEYSPLGLYSEKSKYAIFIREDQDFTKNLWASSVIVHEYVHYLQVMNGKTEDAVFCSDKMLDLEYEAIGVQQKYLKAAGRDLNLLEEAKEVYGEMCDAYNME